MTRLEFYRKYMSMQNDKALSEAERNAAKAALRGMRAAEAAYDAVLDHALPEIAAAANPGQADDEAYLLRQKMRHHAAFADLCADALENGEAVKLNPALEFWQGDFDRMVNDILRVNGHAMPVYVDAIWDFHAAEAAGRQENILDQRIFFRGGNNDLRVLTPRAIETQSPGMLRYDIGVYAGNLYAVRDWSRTAGVFALRDWMAATEQEPITLSECERVRDLAVGSNPNKPLTLSDVFGAWEQIRPRREGEPVRRLEDFSSWCRENGRDFDSPEAWRKVLANLTAGTLGDRNGFGYVDLFAVDKASGRRLSESTWAHAFLNDDLAAQAAVLGKTPARRRERSSDSRVYYVAADDTRQFVDTKDAYDGGQVRHMGYDAVPMVRLRDGSRPAQADMRLALMDTVSGKVSHESPAYGAMDRLGLSAFRPFMKKDIYAAFEAQAAAGQISPRKSGGVFPESQIRTGIAVLEELEKRGLDYEVRLDEARGQLTAVIEEPVSVQFRVLDAENPEMLGRAYYNYTNVITRFAYDRDGSVDPETGKYVSSATILTPQMARDLVAYSLGETVAMPSAQGQTLLVDGMTGAPVGSPSRDVRLISGDNSVSMDKYDSAAGRHLGSSGTFVQSGGNGTQALYTVGFKTVESKDKQGRRTGMRLTVQPVRINTQQGKNSDPYRPYGSPEAAREALRAAVERARDYVRSQAELVTDAEAMMDFSDAEDPEKVKAELEKLTLSDDPYIESVQRACVEALTAPGLSAAEREGAAIDALNERLDALGSFSPEGDRIDFANVVKYSGSREAAVLRAACEAGGAYSVEFTSQKKEAAEAVSEEDIGEDEERKAKEITMNRVKERTIRFDPETARDIMNLPEGTDPFWEHVSGVVKETLTTRGVRVASIEVDDQGIIRYKGDRDWGEGHGAMARNIADPNKARDYSLVEGTIGQVFAPDSRGVVVTRFAHGDNYAMVPGYTATVVRGEESVESRTILKGYQQTLDQKIRAELHQAVSCCNEGDPLMASGLNRLYRHLYDERYPENYEEHFASLGMGEDVMNAIIATQARAVRYDKRFIEESTLNARVAAERQAVVDGASADGYSVTGRDMSVLGWSEEGYFDGSATPASTNQGITRYLVSGARVREDGRIEKSPVKDDQCPMLALPVMDKIRYNPADRRAMVFSNAMHCFGITGKEKTAHMTLQGWTMDDAFVISKDFAERHMVLGEDKKLRPMRVGDKICDLNGNKGVISLVVDPEMGQATAAEQGIAGPVALFRKNPGLAVVGSPFTAPSRMNGGTARGMMEMPEDLKLPDGKVIPGGIGSLPYIITDKTVDEKTHTYGDEEIKAGKGRSVSSQMLWSLQARGAEALVSEFFDGNAGNLRLVREKLIAMGMDLDEEYTLVNGYVPHRTPDGTPEQRPILELPTPDAGLTEKYESVMAIPDREKRTEAKKEIQKELNEESRKLRKEAGEMVSRTGGFLRLPFPLKMACGEETAAAPDGNGWLLPVMPLSFRAQQSYDDDTAIYHDYTREYRQIAEQATAYALEEVRPTQSSDKGDVHKRNLDGARIRAQEAYDRMAKEIRDVSFDNKWNDWKKKIMSRKVGSSITAVGTPDPRLDLDEIAMSSAMMKHMGVGDGDNILIWRDPQLRPEGVAYMRVHRNDELHGISMNPAMDKRFDGDFDGDTWGAVPVRTEAGKKEAQRLFGVAASLVDLGATPDGRTPENIVLALNEGLDIASARAVLSGTEEGNRLWDLRARALVDITHGDGEKALDALNKCIHGYQAAAMGTTVVRYGSMEDHLNSVMEMIDSKAKGKVSGFKEYTKWLGVDAEVGDEKGSDGKTPVRLIKDYGTPGLVDEPGSERREMLRNMDTQVNMATSIKNFGTGLAGAVSQKNAGLARKKIDGKDGDTYLRYALETTYGATQGIVQAKHDAKEAIQKYKVLTDALPALYSNNAIEMGPDGTWRAVRGEGGGYVRSNKKQFIEQYVALCASKTGLNCTVARDNIEKLAECLFDGNEDNFGRDSIRSAKNKRSTEISTMDHCAYAQSTFDTVVSLRGRKLFDTELTRQFAPKEFRGSDKLASLAAGPRAFEERPKCVDIRLYMGKEAEEAARRAAEPAAEAVDLLSRAEVSVSEPAPVRVPASRALSRPTTGKGAACVARAEEMKSECADALMIETA